MKKGFFVLIIQFAFVSVPAFTQVHPDPEPAPVNPRPTEEVAYEFVDEPAEFPGGTTALLQFISDNLQYPESVLKGSVQGKCHVKLLISDKGEVQKIEMIRGVPDCPDCYKEVTRVINLMPRWKPARVNGKNVSSYYRIPINFKL